MANITDIATLGFDIDSTPAVRAARDLDNLAASAKKTSRATDDMRLSSQNSMRATAQLVDTMMRNTRASVSAAEANIRQASATREAAAAVVAETRATQASVQAKIALEQARQREARSSRDVALSLGRENQLKEYANRLDRQAKEQLLALAAAQDKYNQSLRSYGSAESANRSAKSLSASMTASSAQSRVNSATGVGFSTGHTQADIDAMSASLDELRAKYNPIFAASKQYETQLNELNHAHKIGAISTSEHRAAEENLRKSFENNAKAGNMLGRSSGQVAQQMRILSYQVNDVVSGLAMGQSPFMILTQQGGQFVQIMQDSGMGPIALIKKIGSMIGSVLTPARLLGGGLLGIGIGLVSIYAGAISREKELQSAISGTGRAAGVTASELNEMSKQAANSANISEGSARKFAMAYAKSGKVSGDSIRELTAITADYAATAGIDTDEAVKQLTGAFSNLGTGIDSINKAIGGIGYTQREYIKQLEATGQHQKAVDETIKAMKPNLIDHANQLSMVGRAWEAIKNSASGALNWMMTASNPDTNTLLQAAKSRLASSGAIDPATGQPYYNRAAEQNEVNNLTYKLRMEREAAARNKKTADAQALADTASPALSSFTPSFSDRKQLQAQADLFSNLMNNAEALKISKFSYAEAEAAQRAYTDAVRTYLTPAERATKQAQLDAAAAKARTPEQKAAIASQQVALSLQGQAISADEKAARQKAAYNSVIAEGNQQRYIENETARLAIDGNLALAKAWMTGAGAAAQVTAHTQAAVSSVADGGNVAKRTSDIVLRSASDQVAAAAQSVDALRRQGAAQTAANDAVAEGVISYTQAATFAQQYSQIKDLEILKTNATVAANKELVKSIDAIIAATKVANDNELRQRGRALFAQTKADLEDQLKFASMSADERERESAVLNLIRASNGKITDSEKEQVKHLVASRQEMERMRSVLDDVSSGFQDFFQDIFESGKFSFDKLFASIRASFAQLLAYMATQAIMQPIIIPMVQSFFGNVGSAASSLGFGATGGASGSSYGGMGSALGALSNASSVGSMFGVDMSGLSGGIGNGINWLSQNLGFGYSIPGIPGATMANGLAIPGIGLTSVSGSLFGSTTLGGALGSFMGGSLIGGMMGGNSMVSGGLGALGSIAATSLLGGTGIGTALGSFLGPAGMLVGGLLGGALGNFGASNQATNVNLMNGGLSSSILKSSGNAANDSASSQVTQIISEVVTGLKNAGITTSLGNLTGFGIGADKTYVYGANGYKQKLAGGGGNAQGVIDTFMNQILGSATGGDATTQAILNKYRNSGSFTKENLSQLYDDLDFAKTVANLDFTNKQLTQSEQLLKNINDQFNSVIDRATELGLDVGKLTAQRDSAIQSVIDDYNDAISTSIAQMTDPVKFAFEQVSKTLEGRLEEAKTLGADIARVSELNKLEMDSFVSGYQDAVDLARQQVEALKEQQESVSQTQQALAASYNQQAGFINAAISSAQDLISQAYSRQANRLKDQISSYSDVSGSLGQYSSSLLTGSSAPGSSLQQYSAAKTLFEQTAYAAAAGNKDAMGKLQSVSEQFLSVSKQASATSMQYSLDIAAVRNALNSAQTSADQQVDLATQQLVALNQSVEGIGFLSDEVKGVKDAIEGLGIDRVTAAIYGLDLNSITAAVEAISFDSIVSSINGIPLDKIVNAVTGLPIGSVVSSINGLPITSIKDAVNAINTTGIINSINGIPVDQLVNSVNGIPIGSVVSSINGLPFNALIAAVNGLPSLIGASFSLGSTNQLLTAFDQNNMAIGYQQLGTAQAQLFALNQQVAGLGVIDNSVKSMSQAISDLAAAKQRDEDARAQALGVAQSALDLALKNLETAKSYADGSAQAAAAAAAAAKAAADAAAAAAAAAASSPPPVASNDSSGYGEAGQEESGPMGQDFYSPQYDQWFYWYPRNGTYIGSDGRSTLDKYGNYINQYAQGGVHDGGWRVVGEHGPEMEYTGPSQIYSNDALTGMFDTSSIVSEVRTLNDLVKLLIGLVSGSKTDVAKIKNLLTQVSRDGQSIITEAA